MPAHPFLFVDAGVTLAGAEVPGWLAGVPGAPRRLYLHGRLPSEPVVAVVGARRASFAGRVFARHLARELTREGVHVASGGAEGIDTAAHEGALACGASTTVVAPSGWEHPFPPTNSGLFRRVVDGGGGYLSVRAPGQGVVRGAFLRRNLVLAALASALVIVEARERSGARHAARCARQLGRPVLVVPHAPWRAVGRGCLLELLDGAAVAARPSDVLSILAAATARASRAVSGAEVTLPGADRDAAALVLAAIDAGARDLDALTGRTGLTLGAVQLALVGLELGGQVILDSSGQPRRT